VLRCHRKQRGGTMPRPKSSITPNCPSCGSHKTSVNQYLASGSVQYRCRDCKHAWTPDPKPKGGSKPKVLDRPLTNAECQARYRKRKKGMPS